VCIAIASLEPGHDDARKEIFRLPILEDHRPMVPSANSITVARDWLDYVAVGGVFISAAFAFVALMIANSSASDAHESAQAAERQLEETTRLVERVEEQLDIQREAHKALMDDRARRPVLETSLLATGNGIHGPASFLLECKAQNVGDKKASDVLARLLVPEGTAVLIEIPGGGVADVEPVPTWEAKLKGGSRPRWAFAHDQRIDLSPGPAHLSRLAVIFDDPGDYEVWFVLHHPELEHPVGQGLRLGSPQPGDGLEQEILGGLPLLV
jgi:hypothetical protein